MSYQDTLQHLQETLHIERQLETYPEWIHWALMVFGGALLLAFFWSYMRRILNDSWSYSYSNTSSSPTLRSILNITAIIGFIGTCTVGIIALFYARPYVSLTHESEQSITTYLSQMDSDEYTKLKQQVEVNRSETFDDRTTQAIHEQLVSTLSPRQRSWFFFVRY